MYIIIAMYPGPGKPCFRSQPGLAGKALHLVRVEGGVSSRHPAQSRRIVPGQAGDVTPDQFARMTQRVIARGGFEGYLPTACYPLRREVVVLEGAPQAVTVESELVAWAARRVEEGEEFLVAFNAKTTADVRRGPPAGRPSSAALSTRRAILAAGRRSAAGRMWSASSPTGAAVFGREPARRSVIRWDDGPIRPCSTHDVAARRPFDVDGQGARFIPSVFGSRSRILRERILPAPVSSPLRRAVPREGARGSQVLAALATRIPKSSSDDGLAPAMRRRAPRLAAPHVIVVRLAGHSLSTPREAALARIRTNIERWGSHVYVVQGKRVPRFVYTIGWSPTRGAEVVFAGGAWYSSDQARLVVAACAALPHFDDGARIDLGELGAFSLRRADPSWVSALLLGANDYYRIGAVPAVQVVPDAERWTLDVPDLTSPFVSSNQPIWRGIAEPWQHPVPEHSTAVTNLSALRGGPITEAGRWEEDYWELFAGAGPDVLKEEIREVPLATLLGADASLLAVLSLPVGKGLWRDPDEGVWHEWG